MKLIIDIDRVEMIMPHKNETITKLFSSFQINQQLGDSKDKKAAGIPIDFLYFIELFIMGVLTKTW